MFFVLNSSMIFVAFGAYIASYKELGLLQYLLLITDMCPDIFAKHDKRILQSMKESKSTTQTL